MNTVSVGHMARVLEVSKELRKRGHEITVAGDGRFMNIFTDLGFPVESISYVDSEAVKKAVYEGRWKDLYNTKLVSKFIEDEVDLIKKVQPDAVLYDFRLTVRTSAELMRVPTISILNTHMATFRKFPMLKWGHIFRGDTFWGQKINAIFKSIELKMYDSKIAYAVNQYRKEKGLNELYANEHDEGDLNLLADNCDFNPMDEAANVNAHFVGPLVWNNQIPFPEKLRGLDPSKKTVFWILGSVSRDEFSSQIDKLNSSKYQFIVLTGFNDKRPSASQRDGVFELDVANLKEVLPLCDVVCCHSGNGTIYQSLEFGLPVLGMANHDEQYYNGLRLQALGLGYCYSPKQTSSMSFEDILSEIDKLIHDKEIIANCERFKLRLNSESSARKAAEHIQSFFAFPNTAKRSAVNPRDASL